MPSLHGVRCRGLKTPGAREYRRTGWSVDRKESKKDNGGFLIIQPFPARDFEFSLFHFLAKSCYLMITMHFM